MSKSSESKKLSLKMIQVLKIQGMGYINGMEPISSRNGRTREALRKRGFLDGYKPTVEGWSLLEKLFLSDSVLHGYSEKCRYFLATGAHKISKVMS